MWYEDEIDEMLANSSKDLAMDIVLYVLEQHILEDGVKGQDKFQDLVGEGWQKLWEANKVIREGGFV
jgi:hypothetical protein